MKPGRRVIVAIVAGALALAVSPAFGQVPPPAQGRGAGGQRQGPPTVAPNMTVGQVEQLFDAWEILQAKGPLKLDDTTFLTFMARFQRLQVVQRQHQAARQKQLNELRALVNAEPATDEATLGAKTKALDDLEMQHAQDFDKAMAAVDQVLTVKQRAQLRIFMNQMERQKLDLLAQARQQTIKTPNAPASAAVPGKIIK